MPRLAAGATPIVIPPPPDTVGGTAGKLHPCCARLLADQRVGRLNAKAGTELAAEAVASHRRQILGEIAHEVADDGTPRPPPSPPPPPPPHLRDPFRWLQATRNIIRSHAVFLTKHKTLAEDAACAAVLREATELAARAAGHRALPLLLHEMPHRALAAARLAVVERRDGAAEAAVRAAELRLYAAVRCVGRWGQLLEEAAEARVEEARCEAVLEATTRAAVERARVRIAAACGAPPPPQEEQQAA